MGEKMKRRDSHGVTRKGKNEMVSAGRETMREKGRERSARSEEEEEERCAGAERRANEQGK